jgi:DNA modification methylase
VANRKIALDGVNGRSLVEPPFHRPPVAGTATQTIYCGDNLEKLRTLPDECVDLVYINPPFNSNRNYEVFWGDTREKRAFEDRHESTSQSVIRWTCSTCWYRAPNSHAR